MIANGTSKGDGHGFPDYIYSDQTGENVAGDSISASNRVYSFSTAFVPTANFNQNIAPFIASGPSLAKYSLFSISGTQNAIFNSYAIDTISITSVPEPEAYAMLLAGLGLVGVIARRRRQA